MERDALLALTALNLSWSIMTNVPDPDDVRVIEFPADVHVYTEDDDNLKLPKANRNGDHTGGMGPL